MSTREVEDGARVARDVHTGRSDAIPLLREGALMTPRYRDALLRAGIFALYIDDRLGEGIEVPELISSQVRRRATTSIAKAFDLTHEAFASGQAFPDAALRELQDASDLIGSEIERLDEVAVVLSDLSSADTYTLQHSIDVAALGLLIGQRLFRERGFVDYRGRCSYDRIDRRLAMLGLGLLVHDIGKLTVPIEIRVKPGKLTEEEWAVMRTHPLAGLELLPSHLVSPLVKVIVRSHHERWDGSGYPDGLAGSSIHELARIAAVADVYDAVTSERPFAAARPAHVGVELISDGAGSAFDEEIVAAFRQVVVPFPPGVLVELSNGWRGVVAAVRPGAYDRPVVRVGWDEHGRSVEPIEIDLASEPSLGILRAAAGPDEAVQRAVAVA